MKNLFNKRGSHVGIVLSFVIFVTFVIFIFSILEPKIKINQNKEALLDNIKIKFVDEVSAESLTTSISISVSGAECDLLSIDLEEIRGLNSIVKDKNGVIVGSKTIGTSELKIDWNGLDNFYKVYSAEENLDGHTYSGTANCEGVDAQVSSVRSNKYVSENKIVNFIRDNNFESLNIPDGTGFDVIFEDAGGGITKVVPQQEIGDSVSVYSDRFGVQYFDKEANIKTGFITIRVY